MADGELSRFITEVVAAAGRGAASLRRSGTDVVLEACSIEVTLDDQPEPSAQVRITFADRSTAASTPTELT